MNWHSVAALAAKDVRLLWRDRLALFFVFGVPLIYGVFFGVISGAFRGNDVSISVAVIDEDQSAWSEKFVRHLREQMPKADWAEGLSRDDAIDRCRRGKIAAALILPKGFGTTAGVFFRDAPEIELAVDPSRSAEEGVLTGYVMQAMGKLAGERMQDPASMKSSLEEAIQEIAQAEDMPAGLRLALSSALRSFEGFFDQLAEAPADGEVTGGPQFEIVSVRRLPLTKPTRKPNGDAPLENIQTTWDVSFPQAMIWGMLGCASSFAASLVRERRTGTLVRLQAAPLTPGAIMMGKSAACFFNVLLVIGVMLAIGMALGMRPRTPWILVPGMLAVAFCFTGIMTCMSTLGKSEEAVSGASWGANIVMAMLGGGMIPLAFMPPWMQKISHVIPVKWAILILEGGIWREFGWRDAVVPLVALCAIGGLGIAIGSKIIKKRL